MTDIVQALATLDSDPTQAQAKEKVSAQAKAAAQSSSEVAAQAKTALRDAQSVIASAVTPNFGSFVRRPRFGSAENVDGARRAFDRKGRVLCDELLSESQAEAAYQAALSVDPENETAQDALEQLQAVKGNWQRLSPSGSMRPSARRSGSLQPIFIRGSVSTTAKYSPQTGTPKVTGTKRCRSSLATGGPRFSLSGCSAPRKSGGAYQDL